MTSNPSKTKRAAFYGVMVLIIIASLLLSEIAARMILNPADYLTVEMVRDEVLGAVPSPSARGGFDAWGFRNPNVPDAAEIVAIGNSLTYGNTATMINSWPYVLARLSGRTVYNMGLGGYGRTSTSTCS